MIQKVEKRDRLPKVGKLGNVLTNIVLQRELSLLFQEGYGEGREYL